MRNKWKYFGCICLVTFAVLGAYFLPQITSVYTDRRTERKIYTETMQAFATEKETVKERSQRVMKGAGNTGMVWGDVQDVGAGGFRIRVKKELQKMKAVGLLPDVFAWKWVGKERYSMTAYYWNLNEDIEDYGDMGLWHVVVGRESLQVELDMDASTYKIYHVSIYDNGKKLDEYTQPKREDWIKGFEAYYGFAPLETEKKIPNKIPLWEDEVYRYMFIGSNGTYGDGIGLGYEKNVNIDAYYYVEGFSTLIDLHWSPEICGLDTDGSSEASLSFTDEKPSYIK